MAGDGVFSSVLVFCLFGRESDTFCDCFHFVLVWKPSLCLRETLGERGGRLGDPKQRGRRRRNQKFMWCFGWTGRPVR